MDVVRFLDLLFPRTSPLGTDGAWLTDDERHALTGQPIMLSADQLRSRGVKNLDLLIAARGYHKTPMLQTIIHRYKYKRMRALEPVLRELMREAAACIDEKRGVICPVPLHWRRRFERGFNQADCLAEAVSDATGLSVRPLLKRRKSTGRQAKRNRDERLSALSDAFVFAGEECPDRVMIIDDVATTCSTLDACAAALKERGVRRVIAVVLAVVE